MPGGFILPLMRFVPPQLAACGLAKGQVSCPLYHPPRLLGLGQACCVGLGFAPFPPSRKFDTVIHTRIHSNRANYHDKYIVYFTLKVLGIRRSQGSLAGTLLIP